LSSSEKHICLSCELDLPVTDDFKIMKNELTEKFAFIHNLKFAASYLYFKKNSSAQSILHNIKYTGKPDLSIFFGIKLGKELIKLHFKFDVIIPVPLHPSRLRSRGYNQSEGLAIGISEITDIPIDSSLVQRIRKTTSQTQKSKMSRWKGIQNIYSTNYDFSGMSVLIVDDVITTGATVGELADLINLNGVKSIGIVSLARAK